MSKAARIIQPGEAYVLAPGVVTEIPLELIVADPLQVRTEFADEPLQRLAADIKRRGVQQPVELRSCRADGGADINAKFRLVTGERRWRAATMAGLQTIPALLARDQAPVKDSDALALLLHQAGENVHREDLSIVDKALLMKRLRDDFGMKVGEIPDFLAEHGFGQFSRPYVSNLVRMLELPEEIVQTIREGLLPMSAAKHFGAVMHLPAAAEVISRDFAEWTRETQQDANILTEVDAQRFVGGVLGELFPIVEFGHYENAPYYDVDAHAPELGILEFTTAHGRQIHIITNLEAHQRLQDEHPKPHPNSPAAKFPFRHGPADTSVDSKSGTGSTREPPAPKTSLLEVRNSEVLEAYVLKFWQDYLLLHHRTPRVINAVLSWVAAGARCQRYEYGYSGNRNISEAQSDACDELKRQRLGHFLAHDLEDDERVTLFEHLLPQLGQQPIVDLVQHLQLKFEECYSIDDAYLQFHTKATLEALVKKSGIADQPNPKKPKSKVLDPEWLNATKKLSTMRAYVQARSDKLGAPHDIAKVWAQMVKEEKA